MTIGLVLYFILLPASDNPKWTLEFSYAIDPRGHLNMTKDAASYLSSAGSAAHLVSRVVCIIITYCAPGLHIEKMMIFCILWASVSHAVYLFLGLRHAPWLWAGTVLINLGEQVLWPGGLLWAENYIHVYQVIVSITTIGQGASGMIAGWVNGRLFDIDPELPFQVAFGFSCMFTLTFLTMVGMARWFSKTYKKENMDKSEHEYTQALLSDDEDDDGGADEEEETVFTRNHTEKGNIEGDSFL